MPGKYKTEYDLKRKYGLKLSTFEEMVKYQGGLCAICLKGKSLCVDHCHITGQVRMLLCSTCNTLLGMAKDNPDILAAALMYLTNPEEVRKDLKEHLAR